MYDPSRDQSWFQRSLTRLFVAIFQLPSWVRPAAIGAVLLFLMTCFRAVFLLAIHPGLKSVLAVLLALLVASAGGALAGFAFVVVRIPLKPLGVIGELLTGVILTCVYLFGILIPAKYWFGDDTLKTRGDWISAAVMAAAFGVLVTVVYWVNVRKYGRL
jgi:hypothetical protein